uniref:Uncharacterized protein LOC117350409 n=1 Tax=Geotrypetes seraphini TaxID=260995 RepID=A0A6P8PGZ4_GEOSA|nr:uncharacterized protein LOC117350409 [Geotrypetes seraphini]
MQSKPFRMKTFHLALALIANLYGNPRGQSATQPQTEARIPMGGSVLLNCTYDSGQPMVMWYLQDSEKAPQFILQDSSNPDDLQQRFKKRFSGRRDAQGNSFPLQIANVEVTDSAVYYCVLRVGSTYTRALTFGKGTRLIVEPRTQTTSNPSVFVLTSDDADDNTAACLAKDFYPKTLKMSMNSTSEDLVESEPKAMVSTSGKYSAVEIHTFKMKEDVQCTVTHEEEKFNSYGGVIKPGPKPSSPSLPKTWSCKPKSRSINTDVESNEKENMLSLTVLGLRVLFAKSLALNVLLSVRVFAFSRNHCVNTGNYGKFTFGAGTRLTVMPNIADSKPSVYVLQPKDKESKVSPICLITDFSPANNTRAVVSNTIMENNLPTLVNTDTKWSYGIVAWSSTEEQSSSTECKAEYKGEMYKPEMPKDGVQDICSSVTISEHFETDEKLNSLSITVLGLRIIFAKTLVINVLMTLRLCRS